jgi:hypothetical protein
MRLALALALVNSSGPAGSPTPAPEPRSFSLTAVNFSDALTGYQPSFEIGSISREPLDSGTLELFYSRPDTDKTDIEFVGLVATLMAGKVPVIDGVPVVLTTDWTEGDGKTAAQADGQLITEGVHAITWQSGG